VKAKRRRVERASWDWFDKTFPHNRQSGGRRVPKATSRFATPTPPPSNVQVPQIGLARP